jgi:hypothetical protein
MIKYTDEVKRVVSKFFQYRNDIDIYTEDEDKDREFYRLIFSRILDQSIKIKDITPLGNKDNLIKRCKAEPENGRKKIFIADADINLIYDDNEKFPNLFILDRYCIENYLIDNNSILEFIYQSCGTKSRSEIEKELNYPQWLNQYLSPLIELFFNFAILNKFRGKFTLYNSIKFHKKIGKNLIFDPALINEEIEKIKRELFDNIDIAIYSAELNKLRNKWESNIDTCLAIVSGKDYLIPMVLIKTAEIKCSKSFSPLEEVKIKLAQHFEINALVKLKKAIESL